MLVRQIADSKLAQFAYLIGCPRTGDAIVIDVDRLRPRHVVEEIVRRLVIEPDQAEAASTSTS